MKALLGLLFAMLAGTAQAQSVGECDWRASARNLVEPWEQNSRTFANGAVRVALLDTVEPAAGAFHLLVISPPVNEMGDPQCRVISYSDSIGFSGLTFGGLQAQYDPAIGLGFAIPGTEYVPEDDTTGYRPIYLLLTLNQQTGDIQATIERVGG